MDREKLSDKLADIVPEKNINRAKQRFLQGMSQTLLQTPRVRLAARFPRNAGNNQHGGSAV